MKRALALLLALLMLLSLTACSGIAEKLLPGSNTLSSNGSLESIEPAATEPALTMDPSATEEPIAASDDLIYEYFQDDGEYEIGLLVARLEGRKAVSILFLGRLFHVMFLPGVP